MELRQLEYFVAVAAEASFTRGAARLQVAQPGVSQQIRRLEAELGAELFDRSTTPVTLTVAGEELLGHARAVLGAAEDARAAIDGLRGVVSGRLQLGAIPGIPHLDLAGVLASFHDLYPNVRISLREQHPADLLAGLRRGEHDVVMTGLTSPDRPDGIDIELLSVEPLVLVTASSHRLADRTIVTIAEVGDEPIVTLTAGSVLRDHVEHAWQAAGTPARIALETSDVNVLTALVARGLGVTVVPRSIVEGCADRARLHTVEIQSPITHRYVAMAWRADPETSNAAAAFLEHARSRGFGP